MPSLFIRTRTGTVGAFAGGEYAYQPTILGLSINDHEVTVNFVVNDIFMCFFFALAVKEISEAVQPARHDA